jgi:hypothetical protein
MVSNLDREIILPYKDKKSALGDKDLYFSMPYNNNYSNLNDNIKNNFNSVIHGTQLSNYKMKLVYSMQPNLSRVFVHNMKLPSVSKHAYHKCGKGICCLTCNFAHGDSFLSLGKFILPMMANSNCSSKFCIYIIACLKCKMYYIGETENLARRMKVHISSALSNSTSSNVTCVMNHFNLSDHNVLDDFRFYIFKTEINDKMTRLNNEAQLIYLFKHLNIDILNEKLPDIYYYKNPVSLFN